MKMKKAAAVVMAATMVAGMSTGVSSVYAEGKDSMVACIPGDPTTLAPNGNSCSGMIVPQFYDQLWFLTDGELVMRVATGYERVDETHYTITIQEGIKDTAGNAITASDVLFSIELAKNGTQGYPGATRYIDIENCKVVDDTTLEIVLTQPCSFQMKALSMVNLVSQASYEASPDGMVTTPVGSGPYVLEEYVTGSHVSLEYNPEYWEDIDQEIKEYTVKFIPEAAQRANVILTGEVDFATNLSYTDASAIDSTEGLEFINETNLGTFVLFFNNSSSSVCGGNLDLRKAIAYAINNEAIVAASAGGYGEVSKCSISRNFSDYSEEFETLAADTNYYEYNVEEAKKALEAAGVEEGTTIKLANGGLAGQDVIAQVIQANLAEIGLNVEIATYPDTQAQVVTNQPEDWDIAVWSWTNYPAQSGLATINTFGTSGYFQLEGEDLDELLGHINTAMKADDTQIDSAMKELMTYMYEELPVYGLFDTTNLNAKKSDLNLKWKSIDFPLVNQWTWE